jgi:hypothetical protein
MNFINLFFEGFVFRIQMLIGRVLQLYKELGVDNIAKSGLQYISVFSYLRHINYKYTQ